MEQKLNANTQLKLVDWKKPIEFYDPETGMVDLNFLVQLRSEMKIKFDTYYIVGGITTLEGRVMVLMFDKFGQNIDEERIAKNNMPWVRNKTEKKTGWINLWRNFPDTCIDFTYSTIFPTEEMAKTFAKTALYKNYHVATIKVEWEE